MEIIIGTYFFVAVIVSCISLMVYTHLRIKYMNDGTGILKPFKWYYNVIALLIFYAPFFAIIHTIYTFNTQIQCVNERSLDNHIIRVSPMPISKNICIRE